MMAASSNFEGRSIGMLIMFKGWQRKLRYNNDLLKMINDFVGDFTTRAGRVRWFSRHVDGEMLEWLYHDGSNLEDCGNDDWNPLGPANRLRLRDGTNFHVPFHLPGFTSTLQTFRYNYVKTITYKDSKVMHWQHTVASTSLA